MSDVALHRLFSRARLDDRQINELVGLAHGLIADGSVNQAEAEYLFKWIAAHRPLSENPLIALLYDRVDRILSDGRMDADEAADLLQTLSQFCAGEFELGEALKSTSLPLCHPAPVIRFEDANFCFTGTFAFGSRAMCEAAVGDRGGKSGSLTLKTNYLVIGIYAADVWVHSSYGRKIEKAVEMRSKGVPISIVGEEHWAGHLVT